MHLSIKNAPDDVVERLRERARKNHRSLQGEVLSILEAAVATPQGLTVKEVLERARQRGLSTPAESAAMIRADRDSNYRAHRDDDGR